MIKETKNIGIWIRVSTADQAKGESPEHHEERARYFAKSRGWTVKEVYNLAGQSGKAVMQNPETKRMMKDIERGHITGIVFSKLARLSRNRRELEDFSDFFDKHNADLISLTEALDTSTANGRLFYQLLGLFAQWEREEITERINASVLTRAKLGKSLNGSSPFGYVWKDKMLVIHPEEGPIRQQIYQLYLQHRRKGAVARHLNAAGYRTRAGCLWSDTSIARTITDTTARGVYYINCQTLDENGKVTMKPESEWGQVKCEPLVTEIVWYQANQLVEEQHKSWKRPGKSPTTIFGGLVRCSCGAKMYLRTDSPKYSCRKCCNKIPMVDLEDIFYQELKSFFSEPQRVAEHLKKAHEKIAEKQNLLTAHEKEIQKLKSEMIATHRLYQEGQITSQGFGLFYKPAEERLNQLMDELPRLKAEVDDLGIHTISADEVLKEANTLYARWPKLTVDEKRKIAEALVEKITLSKDEIDITFSYSPSSEEACKSQHKLVVTLGITQRSIRISRRKNLSGKTLSEGRFPRK